MGSPWKALADDSRRQVLVLLKNRERTPSEIAMHFDFTLPALSMHLKILRDAGPVSERREGQNKFYSVNRNNISRMMQYFAVFSDDRLTGLKQFVENKERKRSH